MKKVPVISSIAFILLIEASSPLHHADIAHVHHHVGNTAQLACPTGGSGSSVRWRREGGLLPKGAWSDKVGTLHLPGQVENSGVYECFTCSRNESVSARMEITFFPYDAPSQKPIPIYVGNGGSVTLNCWQGGAPHLHSRVFWFKGDSKPLPSHARVEEDGSLVLNRIRHRSTYHCVIPVRYISCVPTHNTFHIHVIGPPGAVSEVQLMLHRNGSLLVSWRPPKQSKQPPTTYHLRVHPGLGAGPGDNRTVSGASMQCWFHGLKEGRYTLSVCAENAAGMGPCTEQEVMVEQPWGSLSFGSDNTSRVVTIHDVKTAIKGSQSNASDTISGVINDVVQIRHQQHKSFPAILAVLVPIASFAACFLLSAAAVGSIGVAVWRRRRYRSYDLASQKQTYRELPHVLVHERSKRLPRRWRKFIESKRKESLVDGSDIDLSFRTGDEEDTRPDIIGEGELSASEGEALLKASRYE